MALETHINRAPTGARHGTRGLNWLASMSRRKQLPSQWHGQTCAMLRHMIQHVAKALFWGMGRAGLERVGVCGEGEGSGTQKVVYQRWPKEICPSVNCTFSHSLNCSKGGGGSRGISLRLTASPEDPLSCRGLHVHVHGNPACPRARRSWRAGGWRFTSGGGCLGLHIHMHIPRRLLSLGAMDGVHRVAARLAGCLPCASADVSTTVITPEDRFVLVASDGIWNCMTSQEVVTHVLEGLEVRVLCVDVLCCAVLSVGAPHRGPAQSVRGRRRHKGITQGSTKGAVIRSRTCHFNTVPASSPGLN